MKADDMIGEYIYVITCEGSVVKCFTSPNKARRYLAIREDPVRDWGITACKLY